MVVVAAQAENKAEKAEPLLFLRPRLRGERFAVSEYEFKAFGFGASVDPEGMVNFICSIDQCVTRSALLAMLLNLWKRHGRPLYATDSTGSCCETKIESVRLYKTNIRHGYNPIMIDVNANSPVYFTADCPHSMPSETPPPLISDAPHQIVELRLAHHKVPYIIDPTYNQAGGPLAPQVHFWPADGFPDGYLAPHAKLLPVKDMSIEDLRSHQLTYLSEFAVDDFTSMIAEHINRMGARIRQWARSGSSVVTPFVL